MSPMRRVFKLRQMLIGIFLPVVLNSNEPCDAMPNVSVYRPASCTHRTFCENTAHYPIDIVRDAMSRNPHLRDYANVEIDTQMDLEQLTPEEEPLCVSTEQIVYPKLAMTRDSEWKYVINHGEIQQSVRVEICREEDKPCRVIEGFAEGYYTKCKQKYIYRQLLSLTSNGSITPEYFQFPASCCCHIEFRAYRLLHQLDDRA